MFLRMPTPLNNDLLIEHNWVTFSKSLLHFSIYAEVKHPFTVKKLSFKFPGRSKTNLFPRVVTDLLSAIQKMQQLIKWWKKKSMVSFAFHFKTTISLVIYVLDWHLEGSWAIPKTSTTTCLHQKRYYYYYYHFFSNLRYRCFFRDSFWFWWIS